MRVKRNIQLLLITLLFAIGNSSGKADNLSNKNMTIILTDLPTAYEDLIDHGRKVYLTNCSMCHGQDGAGNGPAAAALQVKPRNFTDKAWMAGQADGGFVVAALYGIPGSAMPSFKATLSEQDIWSAVAYIRQFASVKKLVGDSTSISQKNGKKLFQQHCSGCHGNQGKGNGPAAQFFVRAPRNLTNMAWLAAYSDSQLYHILMRGVEGSPMPAFRDMLSYREAYAVIKHLRVLSNTQATNTKVINNQRIKQGRSLYLNHCAMCHGIQGGGNGPVANQFSPQPRNFRNPRWMHGQSDAYLAKVIEAGKRGTAMPPFKALLSQEEIMMLIDYLRSFVSSIKGNRVSQRGYTQDSTQ